MVTHKTIIERTGDSAVLKLVLGSTDLNIVLTDDKPNDVKIVFNKLLERLKSEEFEFKLEDSKEDLYHHLCKEYITQLNVELKSIYKELQDHGLFKVG
jgi:hypothetical protein